MGCIRYFKNNKRNEYGRPIYYYRFLTDKMEDMTEYFGFLGKKTRLKIYTVISSRYNPDDVYKVLNSMTFYTVPELGKAQADIDKCNNRNGCDTCCSKERRLTCSKLVKHAKLSDISAKVRDIIYTNNTEYINMGDIDDYYKKIKDNTNFEYYELLNDLNLINKYDTITKFNITYIDNNKKQIMLKQLYSDNKVKCDISNLLNSIAQSEIGIINLNQIKYSDNFDLQRYKFKK